MNLYHGTDEVGHAAIMGSGFKPGTYFTPYLDTAISMGGAYVFTIDMPDRPFSEEQWQFRVWEPLPLEKILYVQKFGMGLVYLNKEALLEQKREACIREGKVMCEDCGGGGEHRSDEHAFRYLREPGGASFKNREPINICKTCKGRGYTQKEEVA